VALNPHPHLVPELNNYYSYTSTHPLDLLILFYGEHFLYLVQEFKLGFFYWVPPVAEWLRCCATNRKVVGSIPAGAIGIFH